RGRRVASGAWLGAAAVAKAIPAFLVLFVVARRDWRGAAGVGLAGVVGLGVIPVCMWGVDKTVEQHTFFVNNVLLAGTTGAGGEERFGQELTETNATDSQSFQSALHHIRHFDLPRENRPPHASAGTRLTHWGLSGVLTLVTLVVARRRLTPDPADQLVLLGCLFALMMVVTPVSHMHYYAFLTPLASALWLKSVAARPGAVFADTRTVAALAVWSAATSFPLFTGPPFSTMRDVGLGTAATVGLWAFGLGVLGRGRAAVATAEPAPAPLRRAA
ncbi:MAG TPA: glycosyltransferase 87 family protein, partial [Urbifossiella sp.]|nr:glycosyltransferase 87 family protein [Urbifossiella sp.]